MCHAPCSRFARQARGAPHGSIADLGVRLPLMRVLLSIVLTIAALGSTPSDSKVAISGLSRFPTDPETALKADIDLGIAKFQAAMTVGLSIIGMNEEQL